MNIKIGIVADTHDNIQNIRKAVAFLKEEGAELVLHAGDYVAPFSIVPWINVGCPVVGVFGNNDGEKIGVLKKFEEIGELHSSPFSFIKNGYRILLMHEPVAISELFSCGKFDLIVYGHTHKRDIQKSNSTILINPGECCGWLDGEPAISLIDMVTRKIKEIRL